MKTRPFNTFHDSSEIHTGEQSYLCRCGAIEFYKDLLRDAECYIDLLRDAEFCTDLLWHAEELLQLLEL